MHGNKTDLEYKLIFLHIHKTAGTTLDRVVSRQYKADTIFRFTDPEKSIIEYGRMPEKDRRKYKLITGHMAAAGHSAFVDPVHNHIPSPCIYITLLRDPVSRVISQYYHVLRHPNVSWYGRVQGMSLRDFVRNKLTPDLDNGQTRVLCTQQGNSSDVRAFGQCSVDMLEGAKRNLMERFAVVGLTERFDETLVLLQRTFGWRNIFYLRQNVSTNRPRRLDVPGDVKEAILECNELDIQLYRFAAEVFQQQIDKDAASFERDLKRFKILNKFLGRTVHYSERFLT